MEINLIYAEVCEDKAAQWDTVTLPGIHTTRINVPSSPKKALPLPHTAVLSRFPGWPVWMPVQRVHILSVQLILGFLGTSSGKLYCHEKIISPSLTNGGGLKSKNTRGEWIKTWNTHTRGHHWVIKKNEMMPSAATQMDPETVTVSGVSQTEEEKYHTTPLLSGI